MARINRYNLAVVLFVAVGSFSYGFNSSIIASVVGLPSFYSYFNLTTSGPRADWSTQMIGATNSIFAAGGLLGALFLGWLADSIGRKRSIQLICLMALAATIITTASVNITMFLTGRGLQGFAAGMIDTVCPLYQSEVSPAHARGRLVGSHAFLLVCGYAGASWIGLACFFVEDPLVQWRLCMAFQALAPLLLLLGSPWLPESPRYLIYNGRDDAGYEVLHRLHSSDELSAREELLRIQEQTHLDSRNEAGWLALWKRPNTRKRLLLGFFAIAAAQSSGVLVINNYQIVLYEGLGITGWRALLLLGVYTSWAAFMNWVNAVLLDKFGRIKLMTIGMTAASLMVACEAAMVAKFAGTDNAVGNGFGVFFLFGFITFFAGGMDASCYVYVSELFPTYMRAQGVSFSVAGLFVSNLIYTGSASAAFASIGWRYYLVFVFVPLACAVVIYFYCPETNGLSLEEIGKLFGDEVALDHSQISTEGDAPLGLIIIEGKEPRANHDNVSLGRSIIEGEKFTEESQDTTKGQIDNQ